MSSYDIRETIYFHESGIDNTDLTLEIAEKTAKKLGINSIIVASTRGTTGVKASQIFKGYNLVVVTHHTGYKEPDAQEMIFDNSEKIFGNGGKILTTTHAFGGIGRAVRRRFNAYQVDEIIASSLKIFGPGTKVAIEIVLAAADSGLISVNEDVIAIGGTSKGADTALVIRPAYVVDFFNLKVKEVICKPKL